MKRPYVHLFVDICLAIDGLALVSTGLLLAVVLPAQSRQAAVWGMTRHEWGEVHLWIAVAMLVVVAIHLALNWNWVCSVVGKICGHQAKPHVGWRRQMAAAGCLVVVVGVVVGFLWAAHVMKEADTSRQGIGGMGPGGGPGWRQVDSW